MKVAICDDAPQEREEIEKVLSEYTGASLDVRAFANGDSLLDAIRGGEEFDFLLLDVIMPGTNGMETARELRALDAELPLAFLTSSPDFAIEGYEVRAMRYLTKPVIKQMLFETLEEVACRLDARREKMVVKTREGLVRLNIDEIEYCENRLHYIEYHMINGRIYTARGSMNELDARLLAAGAFFRPHRSFIVNKNYIQSIDSEKGVLVMRSFVSIPMPGARRGEIARELAAWFEGRR